MEAVEFFKTVNRLCKNQGCNICPVAKEGCCMVGFDDDSIKSIEETVSKVEQWAKDHPVKTRQSEFLKKFQDAKIGKDGVLIIYPCAVENQHDEKESLSKRLWQLPTMGIEAGRISCLTM